MGGCGEDLLEPWRSGRECFITSVMKWRSEALLTFGITSASRWGALSCGRLVGHLEGKNVQRGWIDELHTTSVRSSNAYPLSTEFMRTACSLMLGARSRDKMSTRLLRASAFLPGVTESSRSYAMVSTLIPRDFSRKRIDEPGTGCCLAACLYLRGSWVDVYHRAKPFAL